MRICVILLCLSLAQKQFRSGESDMYNQTIADINGGKFSAAIGDIEVWKKNVPDSAFNNERTALYVQAAVGANQPANAVDAAAPLIAGDLNALFEGPAAQAMQLRLLYNVAWAIGQVANPAQQQIATAEKAAHQLMEYDKPLPGVSDANWAQARADMKQKAELALFYLAMLPGYRAMAAQPPDCKAAEAAYTKVLSEWPGKASPSWELGRALSCEAKQDPARFPLAIYYFQRAAALDPTLGDARNDPAKIAAFADNAYIKFHGDKQGLDELRQLAKQSPLAPAGFAIPSESDVAGAKRKAFEQEHPQVALWMNIRERLAAPDGRQYFDSEMKAAAVPKLLGTVTGATPACRPKELLVAVGQSKAEITLKLDKPLTGKPDLQQEIQWEGVPSAFAPDPFMLTMDTAAANITGLRVSPCPTRSR